MESKAIAAALGATAPVVHPFKAQIGHTLGAAGALETLAAATCLDRATLPPAAGGGDVDPEAAVRLLDRAERGITRAALKLSAAFGGANAALVLTAEPHERALPPLRPVHLRAWATCKAAPDLAALAVATGVARDRLARLDALCRLGVAAVAGLADHVGVQALRGAGVVAGHALATLDTNERFDARRRARGPAAVEPRLFPATSPNALAGECAIVWGMTGPSFAVAAGLGGACEALARGVELVAAGDAERVVVIAADDAGPVARDLLEVSGLADRALDAGAVALLLDASAEGSRRVVPLDPPVAHDRGPIGHLALLAWLNEAGGA
jgi:3-oxoacyl-[acyl-carrier-protein] synthase-1/3-oxoacyl-[acyl-carrier-protein] synthase II